MKTNLSTCKTCRHWHPEYGWESTTEGACHRLGNNQLIIYDTFHRQFIAFGENENPNAVYTGENFGCVLHEEMTTEKKENENN